MNKQIGLLLPKSVIYPSINFDLINGLRNCLSDLDISYQQIVTENISVGADDKLIYSACERMILNGAEIIAGYVNPTTAVALNVLFASANAIFIALDSGYHFPINKNKLSNVFSISLQGALCCSISAKVASDEGRKQFAYISSFYDAGYRSAFAFHKCIERSNANITFNYITKLNRNEFTLDPLKSHLDNNPGDVVLASFCGDMLQDFFSHAASNDLFAGRNIYISSFGGEEQWLDKTIYPGADVTTCVAWGRNLGNDANVHFKNVMLQKKHTVNLFSLLGWEAGIVISKIIDADDTSVAIDLLEHLVYDSPRGEISIDKNDHFTHSPAYQASIVKNESTGNCLLVVKDEYANTKLQREHLKNDIDAAVGSFTSWHNVYGCLES